MRPATAVILLPVAIGSCVLGRHSPAPDGDACMTTDDCRSGRCYAGFCGGPDCGCGTLMSCGTTPKTSGDCQRGWQCVGTLVTAFITGVCRQPCNSGGDCPSTWACREGFCMYIPPAPTPPTVTIDSAPMEVELGADAGFSGSATSVNGPIVAFSWQFGDGREATGTRVSHVYTDVGLFTVRALAVDDAGVVGSAETSVRACLALGSECYGFDQQGYCCTGKLCRAADDAGMRCVDP